MTLEMLSRSADSGFADMKNAVDGVSQSQAWAVLPPHGSDFLHSDGSIHGIVLHTAVCKLMYASIAFHQTQIRWRDVMEQVRGFEPDWDRAVQFLHEAEEYWRAGWRDFNEDQLNELRPTNLREPWPVWKLVNMMSHHDSYHAGQVAVLRYAVVESTVPPPSVAEDIQTYCRESAHW